jgi:hypothetical protein
MSQIVLETQRKIMKKHFAVMVLSSLLVTFSVNADDADGPCTKVKEACRNAGFSSGNPNGRKNLAKDCLIPLMSGQKVDGVKVDDENIEMCKAKNPHFGKK